MVLGWSVVMFIGGTYQIVFVTNAFVEMDSLDADVSALEGII